jgi:BirA family biotin operon repressor/biotin-[acetyl-CoA-carboxylase] ligase
LSSIPAIPHVGEPFIELNSIDSTNNYAFDIIQAKLAAHGTACFAFEQTRGKGQRGKNWVSEKGANIILSVILKTDFLQLHQQFYLSVAIALAAHNLFGKYAGEETKIKWPNDIYWRDRKAGGILIETQLLGKKWKWAVVGIGMNINQTKFSRLTKRPVSLKQITGKDFDSVQLAKELCKLIDKRVKQLEKGDFKKILKEYNQHLFKLNEEVKLKRKNILFKCSIKGVNEQGELLIERKSLETISWGEVEWQL